MYREETIAAISTAPGTGGIGIVRISGDRAFEIAGRLFEGKKAFEDIKTHTINYGKIFNPQNRRMADEVLIMKMSGPRTFTREDTVEINCHGGIAVLQEILGLILREGARLAEPGEFTKRAFLNGRIDLSQAEAVIDLINSKTSESSKAAMEQLEGKLSKKLKAARDELIGLIAHIEAAIDYPEYDIEEITGQKVYDKAGEIRKNLVMLTNGFEKGRIIREGISVVIAGRPNVGKSSLLNELAGKSKAIVTDIPGTTRDIIEEYININGIPVKIIDTAGIRQTSEVVEKIGVKKAENAIASADLVIMMLDAGEGVKDEDLEILKQIGNKKTIVLVNKIDLTNGNIINGIEAKLKELKGSKVIRTSMTEDIGIDELEKMIAGLFFKGEINAGSEMLVTNIRHKNLIDMAIKSIDDARAAFGGGMPPDCMSIDIKNAAEHLGGITGESVSENVLHEIFSRFCIGK